MRAAFRTLVALTLMAWGQFAFSADYQWWLYSYSGSQLSQYGSFSSPQAACDKWLSVKPSGSSLTSMTYSSNGSGRCYMSYPGGGSGYELYGRTGDSCPSGYTYNTSTYSCDAPVSCPESDIYAAVSCSYTSSGHWVCPGEVCSNSCSYLTSPNNTSRCDSATQICVNRYGGTGGSCSANAEPCTDSSCAPAPAPNDPAPTEPPCTTYEGTSICIADDNTGCGTVNGVEGCFTPDENCGTYNGTFSCFPQDKPNNNCGYANGQKICFDPNNPTQQIPPTSADHPNNGGNADGNDNNDPMNPADTSGTSPQGSNEGATNESVDDLGEKLGEKIDKTNSLLDGIKGLLDDEYDASAEWSDAEAGSSGTATGDAIGQSVGTAVDEAVAERDAQVEQALGGVRSTVDDFLGQDGELVPGLNSLGGFLPEATGCSDYVIPINAMGVSIQVTLPVCFLSRFTSLIEWVLWCLTAIGLWNIFYSGLRLENAKASKGGF